MAKIPYSKQIQSFDDQISILKSRGMAFGDENHVKQILQNISYYRLSGYWYPLLADKVNHVFKPGSTFEQAYSIYKFDSELRKMILSEIEKIEVVVRTQLAYIMSQNYGGWWFQDTSLFTNPAKLAKTISNMDEELGRSDEDFIKSFKAKYTNHFPPSWIMLEITTFGTMSILYSNLKSGRCKRQIARYFGVADTVMVSWLHSITYIRNVCAHHSRLWNKTFGISPVMPRRTAYPFVAFPPRGTKHVYFILAIIQYWLNIINPTNNFHDKIKTLLAKYPNIDFNAKGFPANWETEPLWR